MWWQKGRKKKENKREKGEANPIKTPCQPGYLPNALLPNTITLAVKCRHNTIHSSYA